MNRIAIWTKVLIKNHPNKLRHNMASQRAGIGATTAALVVIVVIIVGAIGFISLASQSGRSSSSSTPTTIKEQSLVFYSTVSPLGLQLQIVLNSTAIQSGGALTAQTYLYNTLTANLSLTPNFSANPNIAVWDNYDLVCGLSPVSHTFGFALYQGHYTSGNLSQAGTPMLLTPPVATYCPNRFYNQAYIQNVEFAPKSYLTTLSANSSFSSVFKAYTIRMQLNATTGTCTTSPYAASGSSGSNGTTTTWNGTFLAWGCGPNGADAITGYWTMPANGTYVEIDAHSNSTLTAGLNSVYQNYFHLFPVGSYTIVAEDLWNQTAFAYFRVQPSPNLAGSSTSSTNSTCIVSAEGSGFYVTVLSDTGQPIQGVQVSGTRVTQTNGGTCQQNIGTYLTNSTGSVLITPNIGSYYLLSMMYQGKTYTAKAPIEPMLTTYVTLKVPSGNVTINEVYEGGCQTNTEGVTCPG